MDGASVLLFWYRNQMFAIEGRSPAEGAYSEGFIKAKFTQVRGAWGCGWRQGLSAAGSRGGFEQVLKV